MNILAYLPIHVNTPPRVVTTKAPKMPNPQFLRDFDAFPHTKNLKSAEVRKSYGRER